MFVPLREWGKEEVRKHICEIQVKEAVSGTRGGGKKNEQCGASASPVEGVYRKRGREEGVHK